MINLKILPVIAYSYLHLVLCDFPAAFNDVFTGYANQHLGLAGILYHYCCGLIVMDVFKTKEPPKFKIPNSHFEQ